MSDEKILAPLSATEYNQVGELLLQLLSTYENFPANITAEKIFYEAKATGECICLYMLSGAKYLKRNVQGGFTAQIPFQIAYKSFPTSNSERLVAQGVVDDIAAWLEDVKSLPALSDNRIITSITASNAVAYTDEADTDQSLVFAVDAVMEYEAE